VAATQSAGILLYRYRGCELEVLLGHPGGPFWAKKDAGAWSIPKGELDAGEEPLQAAVREFEEETGLRVAGDFRLLTPLKQPGGKTVHAWAVEGEFDPGDLRSGVFTMQWPPRSGRTIEVPELDRVAWFAVDEAATRILRGQAPFLAELVSLIRTPAR
jgi:predicted NUDIX family NTP pyrophosphohydrolase